MHSNGAKGGVLTCGSRSTGNFLLGKKPELGYMTMDGQEVFKFDVKQVPECIKEVVEETPEGGSGKISGKHGTLWKYLRRICTDLTG